MLTNADITIYNTKTDKTTRMPTYHRTRICGVHWFTDQKTQVDDKGLHSADVYKIRIPTSAQTGGKRYVSPSEYQEMEDVTGAWTIQNGDIFVRGLIDLDISKASEVLSKYPDCSGRVISWSDNRRGVTPHFRIGGAN